MVEINICKLKILKFFSFVSCCCNNFQKLGVQKEIQRGAEKWVEAEEIKGRFIKLLSESVW